MKTLNHQTLPDYRTTDPLYDVGEIVTIRGQSGTYTIHAVQLYGGMSRRSWSYLLTTRPGGIFERWVFEDQIVEAVTA